MNVIVHNKKEALSALKQATLTFDQKKHNIYKNGITSSPLKTNSNGGAFYEISKEVTNTSIPISLSEFVPIEVALLKYLFLYTFQREAQTITTLFQQLNRENNLWLFNDMPSPYKGFFIGPNINSSFEPIFSKIIEPVNLKSAVALLHYYSIQSYQYLKKYGFFCYIINEHNISYEIDNNMMNTLNNDFSRRYKFTAVGNRYFLDNYFTLYKSKGNSPMLKAVGSFVMRKEAYINHTVRQYMIQMEQDTPDNFINSFDIAFVYSKEVPKDVVFNIESYYKNNFKEYNDKLEVVTTEFHSIEVPSLYQFLTGKKEPTYE